jgi:hypothetical protein
MGWPEQTALCVCGRQNMNPVLHRKDQFQQSVHILDLTADHILAGDDTLMPHS